LNSLDVTKRELSSTEIDPESLEHLTPEQWTEFLALLDEFSECFSESPGFSDAMGHRIVLKEGLKPKKFQASRILERPEPD